VTLMIAASALALTQPIDFLADVVQFRGDASRTKWEFHYAFADTTIDYTVGPDGFIGELYCRVTATNTTDTIVDEWLAAATSSEYTPTHKQYFTGFRTLLLKPGVWSIDVFVRDVNDTARTLATTFTTTVRSFGLRADISDIMFTLPRAGNVDPKFTRSSVDAVPNPRHEMIGADPSISLYAEVYNARSNKLDTFVAEYQVLDFVRREMMTTYGRLVAVDDGLILREDIPAGALRSGVYTLRVSLKSQDLATVYATSEERFFILNPELPPEGQILISEEQRFLSSEWAVKRGEQLELELELSDVLATNAEKITKEGMEDDRAKQRYLYRFWLVRDPDPTTEQNERLDEFRKMFARANTFYTSAMIREGWRTDRGYILLKYGMPTQVEQYIQTIDTKPYEIWFYQAVQNGSKFYFVDWQVMQNHKLVHSTVIGELRDEKWFERWAKTSTDDINPLDANLPNAR
jgi:GWxTD domain-containing protein